MPLITACPECDTQFVVTQEQLTAYKGKVRCGTCNHVFNAKEYIIEDDTSITPTKTAEKKVENLLKNVSLDETDTSTTSNETTDNALADSSKAVENESVTEHIEIVAPDFQEPHIEAVAAAKATEDNDSPSPVKDLTVDDRLNALAKKKPFNWLLALVTLLLLLTLLAQAIYYLRTDIISRFPQTKPWYSVACKKIGCKIELPKKLALLTIDDSDMKEHIERENVLQFSSTLINHAAYPQAYPVVELTLTNVDDEPVLRRHLTPKQYLNKSVKPAKGIDGKQEVRIKLNLTATDITVAGYRVALSYPK